MAQAPPPRLGQSPGPPRSLGERRKPHLVCPQDDDFFFKQQVSFPANSHSNCASSDPDCGANGHCNTCPNQAEAHDSCRDYSGESFSKDADGTISTSFSATVNSAPGGCCQANSCIGAYFESQVASIQGGDRVYFDYQAFAGGDWFEVAIGLYDDSSNLKQCKVYRGNAMDDYTNDYFDIPGLGNYKLGFFAGSYDRTGGTALGATLRVKTFQMTAPVVQNEAALDVLSRVAMVAAVNTSGARTEGPEAEVAEAVAEARAFRPLQPDVNQLPFRPKPAPRSGRNQRALQPAGRPDASAENVGRPNANGVAQPFAARIQHGVTSKRTDASTSLTPARFLQKEWVLGHNMGFICYNITDSGALTNAEAFSDCTSSCQGSPASCEPGKVGPKQSASCECHRCVARPDNFLNMDSEACNQAYLHSARVGTPPNPLRLGLACCCVGIARIGATDPETWEDCQSAAADTEAEWQQDSFLPCVHRPGNTIGADDEYCNLHYVNSVEMGSAPNTQVMSEGCCCDGYEGQSRDSCDALEEESTTPNCVAIPANEMGVDDDFCNDQYQATVAVGQAPNDIMMSCCSCDGYKSTETCGALVAKAKLRAEKAREETGKVDTGGHL